MEEKDGEKDKSENEEEDSPIKSDPRLDKEVLEHKVIRKD